MVVKLVRINEESMVIRKAFMAGQGVLIDLWWKYVYLSEF